MNGHRYEELGFDTRLSESMSGKLLQKLTATKASEWTGVALNCPFGPKELSRHYIEANQIRIINDDIISRHPTHFSQEFLPLFDMR
jgi:hypothetical protein